MPALAFLIRPFHLLHPLKLLWIERITLFWPIWFAITASAIVFGYWFICRRAYPLADSEVPADQNRRRRDRFIAGVVLAPILICYGAALLLGEDFTYYDNSHFTAETLRDTNVSLQVSPEGGRFWPLGYQEFSVLRHLTRSIYGYHLLRAAQLVCACAMILLLEEEISIWARLCCVVVFLMTPSIVISFSGLIYPEANIVFWLVVFAFLVWKSERGRGAGWAIGALVSAQILLYYKETAFILVGGFAAGRLLLRLWERDARGRGLGCLRDRESRLDLSILFLAAVFLVYYCAAMYPQFGLRYSENRRVPLLQLGGVYLELDALAWVFVCICAVRAVLILRRKTPVSLFWDGLAIGGVSCFAAYLVLGMESGYYLAPVDAIAIMYIARLLFVPAGMKSVTAKLIAAVIIAAVSLQDLSLSAFRMYERKNVIRAKAEIGQAIKAVYDRDPKGVRRLYFPFSTPFDILEFASFLKYIGVPIEEHVGDSGLSSGVLLAGNEIKQDGLCGYRTFMCHPASIPESGDLIVIFPDDPASIESSTVYRREAAARLLLLYEPHPTVPQWMRPLVSRLHVISPTFALRPLPDAWLTASLSVWN